MNHEIENMLTASEGRYPTRAELALLREWAARLDARLAAIEEIRAKEDVIVRQTVSDVLRAYPDFEQRMRGARESCTRDLTLVLRYCAQALLRGDARYLEETLLAWLATILRGVGFAPDFVADTYRTLGRHAAGELTPASAELLRPFIELCVARLGGEAREEEVA
ncbi:MAG: hypothetical protein H6711_17790 [Myxococcales bacterium]|nr:hypothetical protein [Myxococcales bacterium]